MESENGEEMTTTTNADSTAATSPADSAGFKLENSAVYRYINNLSPISPPKEGQFVPECQVTGMFASSRFNLDQQTEYLTRYQPCHHLPSSELLSQAQSTTYYSVAHSSQVVRPSSDSAQTYLGEYQTNSYDQRKFLFEHSDAGAAELLNKPRPQKRRKKASNDDDNKSCNCKKTKCLKLYCDCFSSGLYCAKSCTCQECFNTLDYEDTVEGTREQIEIRNPLAFAPRVQDGITSTPSSARHRRGCNCKRTACLKKYCECFQANIGCSSGCRCEGCENVYGRKGDDSNRKVMLSRGSGITFDEKLQQAATKESLLQTEVYNPYNFTPLSPSFQFPDLQSPVSNLDFVSPYVKSSQSRQNWDSSPTLLKPRKYLDSGVCVQRGLGFPCVDIADPFLSGFEVTNSFDLSNVPNTIPSTGHLPLASSLYEPSSPITDVPPSSVNRPLLQRTKLDTKFQHGYGDGFITPIKSPQEKWLRSCAKISGRNVRLQSVPSFRPLAPLTNPEGLSSNENVDDPDNNDCRRS